MTLTTRMKTINIQKYLVSIIIFAVCSLFLFNFAFAQFGNVSNPPGNVSNSPGNVSNPPGNVSNPGVQGTTIPNPFRAGNTLFQLLETIVNEIILPIGGVLAVLAFIYSGFLYVTAQGSETKIAKAHKALLYTAVGTAILLGSWALGNVIKNTINQLM